MDRKVAETMRDIATQMERTKGAVAVVDIPAGIEQNHINAGDCAKLRAFIEVMVAAPATLGVEHLREIEPALEKMHACWRRFRMMGAAASSARGVIEEMVRENIKIGAYDHDTYKRLPRNKDIPRRVMAYVREEYADKRAAMVERWTRKDSPAKRAKKGA